MDNKFGFLDNKSDGAGQDSPAVSHVLFSGIKLKVGFSSALIGADLEHPAEPGGCFPVGSSPGLAWSEDPVSWPNFLAFALNPAAALHLGVSVYNSRPILGHNYCFFLHRIPISLKGRKTH